MTNFQITKEIDLTNNDGLSSVNGYAAQQHHNAYAMLYRLLYSTSPKRIIEIGTALGGLTQFLSLASTDLGLNIHIKSYDIHHNDWYDSMNSESLEVIVKNIFSDDYKSLLDTTVADFIQEDGLSLVLCDGGNKKNEFNILSQYLKSGDIIMTHDYAPDSNYFNTTMYQKIWNWHEIKDLDIQQSINIHGLKKFMYEDMLSVAWGCFIKE